MSPNSSAVELIEKYMDLQEKLVGLPIEKLKDNPNYRSFLMIQEKIGELNGE